MTLRLYRPITPGVRFSGRLERVDFKKDPEGRLVTILPKKSGRNNQGRVTMRHQGAREKRFLREIDWRRDLRGVPGTVVAFEYDPNRSANLALIHYANGEKRYILAPEGMTVGETIVAGPDVDLRVGNALPLKAIPIGMQIHSVEVTPNKGGQLLRAAGSYATVQGFESGVALIKLPSGETRRVREECYATVGQLGNVEWKNVKFGKAGRKRHMGIRPTVRGTAQDPRSHPHGGGEGRSGEGMPPKTPWGKPARGKKTRDKNRYSNKMVISRKK